MHRPDRALAALRSARCGCMPAALGMCTLNHLKLRAWRASWPGHKRSTPAWLLPSPQTNSVASPTPVCACSRPSPPQRPRQHGPSAEGPQHRLRQQPLPPQLEEARPRLQAYRGAPPPLQAAPALAVRVSRALPIGGGAAPRGVGWMGADSGTLRPLPGLLFFYCGVGAASTKRFMQPLMQPSPHPPPPHTHPACAEQRSFAATPPLCPHF